MGQTKRCYLGVDSHGLHFSLKDSASLNLEVDGKVLINGAMGITGIKKASTFTIGIVLVIITLLGNWIRKQKLLLFAKC
jgi:branched-chain amino acid transport system permease protein